MKGGRQEEGENEMTPSVGARDGQIMGKGSKGGKGARRAGGVHKRSSR